MKQPFLYKPRRCVLELAGSCNLRCRTCVIWTDEFQRNRASVLTAGDIRQVIRELDAAGVESVTFLGGEPFFRSDLLFIASYAAQNAGLSTAVVTNGTLLTAAQINEIVSGNLFSFMIFSIDGPEKIHDFIRGVPGTFERATQAVAALQKARKAAGKKIPKVYMYTTLSALNFQYVNQVMDIARILDAHAIRLITASCLSPEVIAQTNSVMHDAVLSNHSYAVSPSILIPAQEMPSLRETIGRARAQAQTIGIRFMAEEILANHTGPSLCVFLGKDFVITATGEVLPCPMLTGYSAGNLLKTPLAKILSGANFQSQTQKLRTLGAAGALPVCRFCCVEKMMHGGL